MSRKTRRPPSPDKSADWLNEAVQHHQSGRLTEAETLYRRILEQNPKQPDALHLLGVLAHQAGESARAADLIDKALKAHPNFPTACNSLGNVLSELGQTAEAANAYRRALQLSPQYAEAHNNLAALLNAQGDRATAAEHCRRALALHPDYAQAWFNLGVIEQGCGRFSEAIEAYGRALDAMAQHPPLWNNLGMALQATGQIEDATTCYRRAVALRPDFIEALYNLGAVSQNDAENCFRRIVTLRPDHTDSWRALGATLQSQNRVAEAAACFERVMAQRPSDRQVCAALGVMLNQLGESIRAEAAFRTALDGAETAQSPQTDGMWEIRRESWRGLAAALHTQDRLPESAECYRRFLALTPAETATGADRPDALNNLGLTLLDMGDIQGAIESLREALKAQPNYARAHNNLGLAYERAQLMPLAVASYQKALAADPDYAKAHNNLGMALRALDRRQEGAAHLRRALAIAPDYAEACTNYGAILQELDKPAEAETWHRRALDLNPNLLMAHNNLGYALQLLTRVREAEDCYRYVIERDPTLTDAHNNLGMLLWSRRKLEEAEACFIRAAETNPNYAAARLNHGMLQLFRGALGEGWANYDRWRFVIDSATNRKLAAPRWAGESLADRTILLWREQGLGDEIMFASCYPDVIRRAKRCIIECDPRLVSLFARSFPQAEIRAQSEDDSASETISAPDYDIQCPAGALPRYVRGRLADFPNAPYLVPDPKQVALWRDRLDALGPGPKIGVCWRSSLITHERQSGSTRLEQWRPLLTVPGARFVNLQYDRCEDEIISVERALGVTIARWPGVDLRNDLETIIGLMNGLDLVITAPTAIGELAGAVGTPVWRFSGMDWTRLGCALRPWFPTAELIATEAMTSLTETLEHLARKLRTLLLRNEQTKQHEAEESRDSLPTPPESSPTLDAALATAIENHRAGRFDGVESVYRQALAIAPDDARLLHLLGVLLHQTAQFEPAAAFLEKAAALSTDAAAVVALADLAKTRQALGRLDRAAAALRRALESAPHDAGLHANLGAVLEADGRLEEAETECRRAIALNPDMARAHTNLGGLLLRRSQFQEAEACHRRALALEPNSPHIWNNLGTALAALGRWRDAEEAYGRAIALDPRQTDAMCNLGLLLRGKGRLDEAEARYRQALAIDPAMTSAKFNLGLLLLASGRLEQGWTAYEERLETAQFQARRRRPPIPSIFERPDIEGKRVLVWREQGLGDEILFASCYSDLIERVGPRGKCVIECDSRLISLFARSFPLAEVRAESVDAAGCETRRPLDADRHCPVGSLPRLLRPRLTDFARAPQAWLRPDPEKAAFWRARLNALGAEPKIGLCWRSRVTTAERRAGNSRLDRWGSILTLRGARFVSLQYGDSAAEIDAEISAAETRFGVRLAQRPEIDIDMMNDLESVAALVQGLDLVISASTAVSELAGALQVPVWRFGTADDWTTLGTACRPWWSSMRVFYGWSQEAVDDMLVEIGASLRKVLCVTSTE